MTIKRKIKKQISLLLPLRSALGIKPVSVPVLTILIVFSVYSLLQAYQQNTISPKTEHAFQCVKIIRALERYHYLGKTLDNKMSAAIFEKYINSLDPAKHLFTLADINRLKSDEFYFDDYLKKGSLVQGFRIFNLSIERSRQRLDYILSVLDKWETILDFSKNEIFILDYDQRRWSASETELADLWRKELKSHIITLFMDNRSNDDITDTLKKIYSSRKQRLDQTNSDDVFQMIMNSVASSFDPHTQFFPPRASEDFDIHMSLSLEGIGAVLQNEYEYTKVVRLIPKGPADKSNLLMPGDRIIGVGQGTDGEIKDTIGQRIDHVVKLIRGPKNSFVRLKIIPAKQSSDTRTIQIKRDRVKLEEQSAKKEILDIDHEGRKFKIGIIEIPNFYIDFDAYNNGTKDYKSTTRDVEKLLIELKEENINGLIVDLRDNGGGSLKEAAQLTGLFLKSGPVVQIKTKYKISKLYDDDPRIFYTGPLVVLINRMSASASEIFAGAIQDYNRGLIVGTRSFGKGTVQELQPLGQGKLKLTSAKFYRVSGESTQNMGILPDLEFPEIYRTEDTGESSLKGALPWDTTIKTSYSAYPDMRRIKRIIDKSYQKRAAADPGIGYLNKSIEILSDFNDRTQITLNLEDRKRRKKNYETAETDVKNAYLTALGRPLENNPDEKNMKTDDFKDILTNQAALIAIDFVNLSKTYQYSW